MTQQLMTYKCASCGAKGCKLWREYGTYSVPIRDQLRCAPCAAKSQNKDISGIDEDGRYLPKIDGERRTDQIGWMVPAVPAEDEFGSYWGYTSVPQDRVDWWRKLPTLPE
jgi:hypothetical protein